MQQGAVSTLPQSGSVSANGGVQLPGWHHQGSLAGTPLKPDTSQAESHERPAMCSHWINSSYGLILPQNPPMVFPGSCPHTFEEMYGENHTGKPLYSKYILHTNPLTQIGIIKKSPLLT